MNVRRFWDVALATPIPLVEKTLFWTASSMSAAGRGHNAPDVSEFRHCRINHFPLFADKENRIQGIESDKIMTHYVGIDLHTACVLWKSGDRV